MHKFISCDWGTSNLRLRLVDGDNRSVLKEIETGEGIASIHQSWKDLSPGAERYVYYLSVLKKYIDQWKEEEVSMPENIPVVISGMASSSIGIVELPYTPMPMRADGSELLVKRNERSNMVPFPVFIVSGACTSADVMRGEETLLAGCGEFFSLLSRQSILSASVEKSGPDTGTVFFERGIGDGAQTNLLNSVFRVRTNHLFKRASPTENFDYLSGLLIGAELGVIKEKKIDLITVVAGDALLNKYMAGLKLLQPGKSINQLDAGKALVNGHCKIISAKLT
jgi:2-dehydro-3-deoxygalactonokinase